MLALTTPGAEGAAVTVWDGEAVTSAEFFGYYARMLDRKIPRLPAPLVAAGAVAARRWSRAAPAGPRPSRATR